MTSNSVGGCVGGCGWLTEVKREADRSETTTFEKNRRVCLFMWACAIDEMIDRKSPVQQDLMFECDCNVLKVLSTMYPASRHEYSTTIVTSFFESEFLASKLTEEELERLSMHIFFGRPSLNSVYDELQRIDEEYREFQSKSSESARSTSTISLPCDTCDDDSDEVCVESPKTELGSKIALNGNVW